MKSTLVLLLFLFFSAKAFATHNIGGHITYRAESIYKYTITITTYTDTRSVEADRPVIEVNFGDGSNGNVNRASQKSINQFVFENIYTVSHDYQNSGVGKYLISYRDANRVKDVMNADQTVSQPFYLESLLVIDLKECANSSPEFTIHPIFKASINTTVFQTLNIFDENGDSIVYEMTTPLQDSNTSITSYTFPKGLKNADGQLIWKPENITGKFLIAIKIKEYRNGKLMGCIVKEWITDLSITDQPLTINSSCNKPDSFVCTYDARNGNNVSFRMKIPGFTQSNGKFEMFPPEINYKSNPPSFNITQDASGNLVGDFSWNPDTLDISEQPLNFVFSATQNDGIQNQMLVKIYANGNNSAPCYKNTSGIIEEDRTEGYYVYPNPFMQSATIKLNTLATGILCKIYNMQGQKVAEAMSNNGFVNLDANMLSAGIYTFHITTSQKILGRGKFVVQK